MLKTQVSLRHLQHPYPENTSSLVDDNLTTSWEITIKKLGGLFASFKGSVVILVLTLH